MKRLDMLKIMTILKNTFYEDNEIGDIKIEYYLIKRNLIISFLFVIQNKCILSKQSNVQKGI